MKIFCLILLYILYEIRFYKKKIHNHVNYKSPLPLLKTNCTFT